MTALGINNPNSAYNRNERQAAKSGPASASFKLPVTQTEAITWVFVFKARRALAEYKREPLQVRACDENIAAIMAALNDGMFQ